MEDLRPTADEIADLLGPEGPFASEIPGFAARAPQQAMARAVAEAISQGETLMVEAGTGTGKTFAYLVPALLSDTRIVLSTGTKALQDQLFFRDLPRVRTVLGVGKQIALLKGRSNYLCRYRLEQALLDGDPADAPQTPQLAKILAWSARTARGDRMELDAVSEDAPVWSRVTSTAENCLGVECSFYEDCHVVRARRQAMAADIVVVNHHLLMADLALRQDGFGELLPEAGAYILDEAHQLPELAAQFFAQSLSSRQLTDLVRDVLAECHGLSGAVSLLLEPCEAMRSQLQRLRGGMDRLPARGPMAALLASTSWQQDMDRLADLLEDLTHALGSQAERSRGMAQVHARARALADRLQWLLEGRSGQASVDAAGEAEGVRIETDSPEIVHEAQVQWYELQARGFSLHRTPLDLTGPLRQIRARTSAAWIHTSATLSVAGDFSHFARQLGLEQPLTLSLESPFDYAQQALCYLPPGLPDPQARDYTDAVIQAAIPVLQASHGRAFLLFTSHRALRRAAELLAEHAEWPLFVQGSVPRHQLLEAFRGSGNGILLGAASFWEGVDVAGQALTVVLIDKLPFAAPDDPVLQARLEALQANGVNPFTGWQIPQAAIALKQGAGRLIRDIHDRGVLMLCDPRLTGKGYGRLFLRALPAMPLSRRLDEVCTFLAVEPSGVSTVVEDAGAP
ncbi:ATP-dependent DNA helicase [Frateuria aurantia]